MDMNVNGKAVTVSSVISFLQTVAVTYYAMTPHPTSWWELLRIDFVMAWLISFGGVTVAAHLNFRNDDSRTRKTDIEQVLKTIDNDFKDK